MKQKLYILGVVSALIVFTGTIFKVNHWPIAQILLITGMVTLTLVFLPLALTNHYKAAGNKQNLILHVITLLTCLVVFGSMLFKILHWSYAAILLTIALPFPYVVFLPVFLVTIAKNKTFSIYNTVFVLLLLALISVFSALLALNVTRERINDSYNLSSHYNKLKAAMDNLPDYESKSPICIRIDEALKVIDEYRELFLSTEGISCEQWENNPGSLLRPDARLTSVLALSNAGNAKLGEKLGNSLKNLIREIENSPGYEELAKASPVIFDLEVPSGMESEWERWKFNDNNLSWVLIYLDGLETNLKLIRVSINTYD